MILTGSQSSCRHPIAAVPRQASQHDGKHIRCPSCRCEFEVSAALRSELETEVRAAIAKDFEGQASAVQAAADARIREKEVELSEARNKVAVAEGREADLL